MQEDFWLSGVPNTDTVIMIPSSNIVVIVVVVVSDRSENRANVYQL